jgi:hypothetical protein
LTLGSAADITPVLILLAEQIVRCQASRRGAGG